jgi:DNA-binding PadR family transcriptional regulator
MVKIMGDNISPKDVRHMILATIGIVGILAMGALAPNAVQMLTLFSGKRKNHWKPSYINEVAKRLKRQGFITFEKNEDGTFMRLTSKGENELLRYKIKEKLLTKKKWDKCWRVVAFDIKEYKKETRDGIRRELQNFGFIKLQNSVWVFPYDCEDVIAMLKAEFEIGKEVLYIVAKRIEGDESLRKYFGLA